VIFVTVGSVFPFDRLIRAMDNWAIANGRADVVAQIGEGRYLPQHMKFDRRVKQAEFSALVAKAEVVVSHAGMGTVITAGRAGRPLVLLPRRKEWGEHNTDHQVATANWLRGKPGIFVAEQEGDLASSIAAALAADASPEARFAPTADADFTDRLRAGIVALAGSR
jgi:UDP-N-acetylglucosamine transferase subunit ALG13